MVDGMVARIYGWRVQEQRVRRLFANRFALIAVTLLMLGGYGERAFARFLACDCPCCPAEVVLVAPAGDQMAAAEADQAVARLLTAAGGRTADGDHDGDTKGCACLCHAASLASIHVAVPVFAPLRMCAATLHAGPAQRPSEGVRAGIEYPPRAA